MQKDLFIVIVDIFRLDNHVINRVLFTLEEISLQ